MSSKGKSPVALIPQRRFPGFFEPWLFEPLSSVLSEHKVKNTARHEVFSVSMDSGIVNQVEHLGRSYAAADTSNYNVGHRFDVVYTKSPLRAFPFGIVKQCKFDGEVALSPLYGVFTPNNPYVGLMIEAFFEAPERAQAFLSPLCQKGAKNTLQITNETFLSGRMLLPIEEGEQQKIADCLGSADALIAALGRKVEALKAHKKGLMQQLFPQEGETQPRRRFPEFEGAGEWREMSVGDFGQVITGSTPSTADPTLYEGSIPFVSPADISDLRYVDETRTTLTEAGFEKTRPVRAGSILFVCIGSSIGKIAQNTQECATNQQINAVIPSAKHSDGFVYFALSNASDRIALLAGRQAVPIINKSMFSSVRLLVPDLLEQERIAKCLASLDDLIAAESRKLDTLKTHKKGLMQQLFPRIGERDA
ncbi:restriction endonuclease subunit S [Nitratireductor mangrovi]|uniref:Restriction endonuclease subunit S n=1 Tax=Nitratireductor mangrovi TaxID=2599600 RepID=A0A5B8KY53_9HYPH|nr:restriction endonuclease subunit S [Nitratireductor mangrovi]QDZ00555.1 restriction endonuclease subunit S [Nitratireductor mangrovi]